jgi:hypothetical protein
MDMTMFKFPVGTRVVKQGEDSRFEGEVVASFVKLDGKTVRFVIENDDGVLHIASDKQLKVKYLGFLDPVKAPPKE